MSQIEIRDVGPIEAVSIPVPEGGGVVVLRGGNGSGKSTALDAVDTMARGSGALTARARHGTKRGEVAGLGASVTVGLARAQRKGELEVVAFDARVNVATLVDPGLKDPEAADRHRIATACALAGIRPQPARFRDLAGDCEIDETVYDGDDLVTVASRVRAALHAEARRIEKLSVEWATEARTLREAAGETATPLSVEDAQAALEEAIAKHSAAKAAAAARESSERQAAAARERLAAIDADPIDVAGLEAEVEQAAEALPTIEKHVAALREQLREAEQEAKDCTSFLATKRRELDTARKRVEERATAQAALDEAVAAPAAPTAAELDAAAQAVGAARDALAAASGAAKAAEQRAVAEAREADAAGAAEAAERIRVSAQRTDDVLADHLAAVMPQGLLVVDGRLVVERGERMVPFGELSDGERWRVALDIAISAIGTAGLIAIPQMAWEGLDGPARRMIAEHAKERGVTIVTAEADHDQVQPLRAEVFGGAS